MQFGAEFLLHVLHERTPLLLVFGHDLVELLLLLLTQASLKVKLLGVLTSQ